MDFCERRDASGGPEKSIEVSSKHACPLIFHFDQAVLNDVSKEPKAACTLMLIDLHVHSENSEFFSGHMVTNKENNHKDQLLLLFGMTCQY